VRRWRKAESRRKKITTGLVELWIKDKKKNPNPKAEVLVLCDSPSTLGETREVTGREPIQQVGLICIFVGFPIAESKVQSLVSTSVSFTDKFTLSLTRVNHNLCLEQCFCLALHGTRTAYLVKIAVMVFTHVHNAPAVAPHPPAHILEG
jgi:hypothetical protein